MSFGVTGGHFQPAGQLQILTNIVDYGLSVQSAIDHPRMFALGDVFEIEQTVPQETGIGSRKLGHVVTRTSVPLGTRQAIWVDFMRRSRWSTRRHGAWVLGMPRAGVYLR